MSLKFALSYEGENADHHEIDFYDVAQGLIGFQRTLAITTHLVLNGEVITQAPSLKNAQILAHPPKEGSWEIFAGIYLIGKVAKTLNEIPRESPVGHIIFSAYDFIVSNALGFHVDYEKSLGQSYKELKNRGDSTVPILDQPKFDSAIEKCEAGIREMHRPIYAKGTANGARITGFIKDDRPKLISASLDIESYNFINDSIQDNSITTFTGRVSSYNINTFKGRLFDFAEERPIPFEVSSDIKKPNVQNKLAKSLYDNVNSGFKGGDITVSGFKLLSKNGRLKGILITNID
jgi:hypothetical protein